MSLIEYRQVSFGYPDGYPAIRGVDLQISEGERVGIVGGNGAGKTTLVRMLNGILRPSTGLIEVAGRSTTGLAIAELAAHVGYAFQNPDDQLFANTIQADVEFGPRNLGLDQATAAERAKSALELVGLAGQAQTHPHQLSLSDRKLVSLAGVLAMQTPIVVLDEPTTGQDAAGVQLIGELVDALAGQGRTVLAVTHDMDFCAGHFDRVLALSDGQITADGDPRDVFSHVGSLPTAALEAPQLLRLADRLGWRERPLTPAEFVDTMAGRGR